MTDSRLHSDETRKAQALWVVCNSPGDRPISRRLCEGAGMRLLRCLLMACAVSGLSRAATAEPATPINVRDYGATGNGVTDDTAAIQAALSAGSVGHKAVFFPSGVFRFTGTLVGDGTTLNCPSNNAATLLFDDPSGTKDGMTIGHATFNMSGCGYNRKQAGTAGALIHFTDSYFSSIWNNRFDQNAYNIITVDSSDLMPNTIFIHDNIVHHWVNDFVFLNSQNPSYPVYDVHAYNNFSRSAGNAHYEVVGYGQIDVHHNTMTGGAIYNVRINTAAAPLINSLNYIQNNDFDGGILYIANHNADVITGNEIEGPLTLVNDQNFHVSGNAMVCGANTCPVLIQGMVGLNWSANHISGQGNPITIQPSGATKSQDLSFVGDTWVYGGGSYLTFDGGAPAADNITTQIALQGGETLARFVTAPTNFRNLGNTSGPGAAPNFATCTGVGAKGSCALSPGATNEAGTITLNTAGGGEASTGIVKMTYSTAVGPLGSGCTLTLQNSSGYWVPPVSVIEDGTTPTSMQFHWVNGSRTALSDGVKYNIAYNCRGF